MGQDPSAVLRDIVLHLDIQDGASAKKPSKTPNTDQPFLAKEPFGCYPPRILVLRQMEELSNEGSQKARQPDTGDLSILAWYLATPDLQKAEVGTEPWRLTRTKAAVSLLKFWKKQRSLRASREDTREELGMKERLTAFIQRAIAEDRSWMYRHSGNPAKHSCSEPVLILRASEERATHVPITHGDSSSGDMLS